MFIQVRETEITTVLLPISKHRGIPWVASQGTRKQEEPVSNLLGPIVYVSDKSRNIPVYKPKEDFQPFLCKEKNEKGNQDT